jgi:hypothetical protein
MTTLSSPSYLYYRKFLAASRAFFEKMFKNPRFAPRSERRPPGGGRGRMSDGDGTYAEDSTDGRLRLMSERGLQRGECVMGYLRRYDGDPSIKSMTELPFVLRVVCDGGSGC